jgi:hypothetical protein
MTLCKKNQYISVYTLILGVGSAATALGNPIFKIQPKSTFPQGYCAPASCSGLSVPAKPFPFAQTAAQKGFNSGEQPGSAKANAPTDESGATNETVDTAGFLTQIQQAEGYANSQCGKSLSDDSVDTFEFLAPCNTASIYRQSLNSVSSAKEPSNFPAPGGVAVMDGFFKLAKSPENKAALATKKFMFRSPAVTKCRKKGWDVGTKQTLYAGMGVESCQDMVIPAQAGVVYTGMPDGSRTSASTTAKVEASMLGLSFVPFEVSTNLSSPSKGNVTSDARIRAGNGDIK